MKLRVARHTKNLQPLIDFYTGIIGLTVLGGFKDHDGYDGVFIGDKDLNWHLEFTTSFEDPIHKADEDDLLVFYPETQQAFEAIMQRASSHNISPVQAKNPYWTAHGVCITDPDGFGVMIVIPGKN